MEDCPIHAYLSYRCKLERDIQARDKLKAICAEPDKGIRLVYDQTGTEEGDSLIKFMDDLTAARCIFVFLSPEYFQSAYTMYELVSMHEKADLDNRFILPLRACDSIVDKCRATAKDYWYSTNAESNADRYKLADLLKCRNDADELWLRINSAWETLVKPYLDELHTSLDSGNADNVLRGLVLLSRQKIDSQIQESTGHLHDKVSFEIERILKGQHGSVIQQFAELLKLDSAASPGNISGYLVRHNTVVQGLDALFKISTQQAKQLVSRQDDWQQYLYDVEQLCGWLLINTIDPYWWFQTEVKMRRTASQGITDTFQLEQPAYIEVVISRNLLQQARYSLDDYGAIKPYSEEHDVMLFDAISKDASDIELLSPIYKDLRRAEKAPQDVKQLLAAIELTAQSLNGGRDGKPIYYIASKDYLNMLQDRAWFAETESKLAGYLQFICCNPGPENRGVSPCREEQGLVLDKVANLLRLRNPKRTAHD
jgi:hypothetical protein